MSQFEGMPPEAEEVLAQPPDVPSWTENLLFSLYDGINDIGLWLHLGTHPAAWHLWEDRVLISLPGDDGVLTLWAYHQTESSRRPAGANLRFELVEPFRRWRVTFDGFLLLTSLEDLRTGLVTDGPKHRVALDLDVELVTPPWDAAMAAAQNTGRGSMASQEWAREHYEQLCVVAGSVTLPSGEVTFNGTGWRDHSRGPRGTSVSDSWGGHAIMGAWFPEQQCGIGLSRYVTSSGEVSLEAGYLVEDGKLRHVGVSEVPVLSDLRKSGEELRFVVTDGDETLVFDATTRNSMWATMSNGMPYGVDLVSPPGVIYALNFGAIELEGERGNLYLERSAKLR